MPVLPNQRHELFAHAIVQGEHFTQAYIKSGFSPNGAHGSASRLQSTDVIQSRIAELQSQTAQIFIRGRIADRNYRVSVLNDLAERMYVELKAKESLLNSISLLRELREYHKQAAVECGQWEEKQQLTVQVDNDYSQLSEDQIQAALEKMKEARAMLNALPGEAETILDQPAEMPADSSVISPE